MSAPGDDASTKLAKTRWLYRHVGALMVALFIGAAIVAGVEIYFHQTKAQALRVGDRTFELKVADSAQAAALGLDEGQPLAKNNGMLFVLDDETSACFWMKEASSPLDIIWFNSRKHVVHVEQSVTPDSYPHSFCPSQPAKYVIELNAGVVKALGIHEGQALQF